MPEFFDQLWEQLHNPRSQRERLRYTEQLKTLIPLSPPLRRWPARPCAQVWQGCVIAADELSLTRLEKHAVDFYLFDLTQEGAHPMCFRQAKAVEERLPFWRLDPVHEESKVLETRAMGADAYCLDMSQLDHAAAQYLVEVGRDYALPAVLKCAREEDLALALQITDVDYYWLQGILASPQLLDLDWFKGKTLIFDLTRETRCEDFLFPGPATVAFVDYSNELKEQEDE